jgi:ankyrin repeat protein
VLELLKAGADVNSKSAAGGPNALTLAAQNGHLEVVQTLIEAGADVNQPAMQGWTPLMKATFFGHDQIVRALLEAGAETSLRDKHGRTAVDHAQRADNHQLANLLAR